MTLRKANKIFLILERFFNIAQRLFAGTKLKFSMIDFLNRYGQWGLVAGAAEGLGAAYCEELASRGMNVVMVDVQAEKLNLLADRLQKDYPIEIRQVITDLSGEDAPEKCMEAIQGIECRLLIYNAAYSRVKPFLSAEKQELGLYLNVNTRTPLHLAYCFAQYLISGSKTGGILLMSSLAGLWGTRLVAIYSGTKAFNLLLAEALSHELKPFHIDVSACCAGATATPGYLGTNPASGLFGPSLMQPRQVARIALDKLGKKPVIIPGFANRFNYFLLTRILPRSISVGMVNNVMAKTYRNSGF
jgi:short-subunit dehydrogenase